MAIELTDRTTLASDFEVYNHKDHWWVPISRLSDILSFAITGSTETNELSGFLFTEENTFLLNTKKCFVGYQHKRETYPCDAVIIYQNDFFTLSTQIEQWFNIKLEFDSLKSIITISSKEPFPIQAKKAREKEFESKTSSKLPAQNRFPFEPERNHALSGPALDELVSFKAVQNSQNAPPTLQTDHFTNLGGEILGLDTNMFLQGNDKTIQFWGAQLSKTSREGKLLGPLGLNRIQFLDIDTPGIPLLTNGLSGRGAFFSSYRDASLGRYDKQDFFGQLLPGWEVVLYRNGMFVDRQLSNGTGRYRFKNIPLLYGRNNFRFVFFGPRGETREEQKNYLINSSLIKPGASEYWFATMMAKPTDSIRDWRQNTLFNFSYGLTKSLSLSAGFLKDRESAYTLGSIQLFGTNRYFNFAINCGLNDLGGKACEWLEQTRLGEVDVSAKYSRYINFVSPTTVTQGSNLFSSTEVNSQYTIPTAPAIGVGLGFQNNTYQNQRDTNQLTQTTSLSNGSVSINHELDFPFNRTTLFLGKFDITTYLSFLRFRGNIFYKPEMIQRIGTEFSFGAGRNNTSTLSMEQNIPNRTTQIGFSSSQRFDYCLASFDLGANSNRQFTVGLTLSFSLIRENTRSHWHLASEHQVANGAASLKVCIDKDRNNSCDSHDTPVPNLHAVLNGRETELETDSAGVTFIPHLSINQSHSLSLKYQEINDPFLRLVKPGINFRPRPSQVTEIDLPLVTVGNIEGSLTQDSEESKRPLPFQEVLLFTLDNRLISKTKADKYGLYVFEDLAPGDYKVGLKRRPDLKLLVQIPKEGGYLSGVDINVEKSPMPTLPLPLPPVSKHLP